jgi:hypothetical protein
MAQRSIEEHLTDFLLLQRDPRLKDYRRRCLEHWREHYGPATVAKVEAVARERWKVKSGMPKRTASES